MDIIGHLTRTVTPAVLGDSRTAQNESLLQQFYAIFAARLADKDAYGRVATQDIHRDDLGFFDRLWTDENHKTSIARELAAGNNVDESSVKGLVVTAAPLAFNEIKSLAGTTPVPQFLRDNLSTYRDRIPAWAAAILPAGLLGAGAVGASTGATAATAAHVNTAPHGVTSASSTTTPVETKEEGGFLKALLPIIGLIILGALAWALLKGCQENPEPVASPAQTMAQSADSDMSEAALAPAAMTLATGDGNELYACRISAGNDELSASLKNSVSSVFTGAEADKCRADVDNSFATDMPAAAHLGAILPLIKDTPHANVIIEGNEVRVDAPNKEQLDKLVADLKAAAPEMNIVAAGPLDLDAEVENSIAQATAAMDQLGDNPDPRDVARALSLQVINFELDKAEIPDANKEVLDRAVEIMQNVPNMQLSILGHTDNQGNDDYNVALSQRRAEAVKAYLVSQGADASKLMTKGMGETDPIATNETEQGRFRNRRIEFTVYDENTSTDGINVTADTTIDPDLNPLDANNDDVMPDSDDK